MSPRFRIAELFDRYGIPMEEADTVDPATDPRTTLRFDPRWVECYNNN